VLSGCSHYSTSILVEYLACRALLSPFPTPESPHLPKKNRWIYPTSTKYVDGETIPEGRHQTGEQVCSAQHFNPSYGFADAPWGFLPGTKAASLLDFERLHIECVSKRHNLPVVFVDLHGGEAKATRSSR
jgi:hypothetical protein